MEDQDYEDDEMSHASLSSGLSPRESRPRTKPWDLAEGYQVCSSLTILVIQLSACSVDQSFTHSIQHPTIIHPTNDQPINCPFHQASQQ